LAACQLSGIKNTELAATLLDSAITSLEMDLYSDLEAHISSRHLLYLAQLFFLPIKEWRSMELNKLSRFNEIEHYLHFNDLRGTTAWTMLRFGKE